jgi:hypothetical protein
VRPRLVIKRPRTPGVFFLRFPSEESAREVAAVLESDGFTVELEAEPAHWLVTARGLVRKDSFDVAEHSFRALAASRGGRFAGCRREERS